MGHKQEENASLCYRIPQAHKFKTVWIILFNFVQPALCESLKPFKTPPHSFLANLAYFQLK